MKIFTFLAVCLSFTSAVLARSQPISHGCRKNGQLIPANGKYTDPITCMEWICEITQHGIWKYTMLKLTRGACGRPNGRCIYKDEQIMDGCSTYQCIVDVHDRFVKASLRAVRGGCKVSISQDCLQVNDTIMHNCHEYVCKAKRLEDGVKSYLEVSRVSCGRQNGIGKCLYDKEQYKDGCMTYKCFIEAKGNGRYRGTIRHVSGGCRTNFDSQCVDAGATVVKDCKEYKCTETNFGHRTKYTFGVSRFSCGRFNGKCMYENDSFTVGCTKKTCRKVWGYLYYKNENVCKVGPIPVLRALHQRP